MTGAEALARWISHSPQVAGSVLRLPRYPHHVVGNGGIDLELVTAVLTVTASGSSWLAVRQGRRMWRRAALTRRLAGLEVTLPLATDHLAPSLAALVRDARCARRGLETPLSRVLEAKRGGWLLGSAFADLDLALTDARRTLWDWVCGVSRLDAPDYALLRDLQLDPRPLRALLYQQGLFERETRAFAGWRTAGPDVEAVTEGLCTAIEQLHRFEVVLLSHRADPYR